MSSYGVGDALPIDVGGRKLPPPATPAGAAAEERRRQNEYARMISLIERERLGDLSARAELNALLAPAGAAGAAGSGSSSDDEMADRRADRPRQAKRRRRLASASDDELSGSSSGASSGPAGSSSSGSASAIEPPRPAAPVDYDTMSRGELIATLRARDLELRNYRAQFDDYIAQQMASRMQDMELETSEGDFYRGLPRERPLDDRDRSYS